MLKKERSKSILLVLFALFLTSCDSKELAKVVFNNISDTVAEKTGSVDKHMWEGVSFKIYNKNNKRGTVRITASHLSGPPADFVFMNIADYNRILPKLKNYQAHQFEYMIQLSRLNLTGDFDSGWTNIPNGEYVFIIDNSANFQAEPSGKALNYSYTIKATDVVK